MPFFTKTFEDRLAPKESTGGGYLNASSIADGSAVRMAILSEEPLEGYEVWFSKHDGGMTKRVTPQLPDEELLAQLETQVGGTVTVREGRRAIKQCAAFFVYNYDEAKVQVFSANQKTLLADIGRLTGDEDYSDLSMWDLKVSRRGKGTDTKYSADFVPTKRSNQSVAKQVIQAWDEACEAGADLERLYDGGNPFQAG